MKRTISVLLCILVLMTSLSIIATATNTNDTYNYEFNGIEYSVEIDDSTISEEKKQVIAHELLGLDDQSNQAYGLGCILFGHDYKYTTASVVKHKVYSNVPRCEKNIYDVTYCEDCDYTEQTLIATTNIDCCPKD